MATELEQIKAVFSELPKEVLIGIKTMATNARTGLVATVLAKEGLSLSTQVSLFPLKIKKQALDDLVRTTREKTRILLDDRLLLFPPIGSIKMAVENSIDEVIESAADMLFDINRLNSVQIELDANILQLNEAIEFMATIITVVDQILSGG